MPKFRAEKIGSEEVVEGAYLDVWNTFKDVLIDTTGFSEIKQQTIEITFDGNNWYKINTVATMVDYCRNIEGVSK